MGNEASHLGGEGGAVRGRYPPKAHVTHKGLRNLIGESCTRLPSAGAGDGGARSVARLLWGYLPSCSLVCSREVRVALLCERDGRR